MASDGLFKYAKRTDIARVAQEADLDVAATALVELVTLRSGKVPETSNAESTDNRLTRVSAQHAPVQGVSQL